MDRRRAAGALLALAACIACSDAAPYASNQTSLDLYDGPSEGCYYNFQRYGEGDRIMTNEPCLNCTCHNRMLMCYLRVCPFTKPIGQDCTVEKRADQCCPIVTCPDVPVDLLTSTSTSSPAEYGSTGVGKLDKYGCSINGKYLPEGSKVPPTPNKPCEHCYCIRNMTTCVMQECTLHVDGCTPIYHKDVCCPVRYSCDHPEDEMPLLDDMSTTVRPTPGFLLTTTTLAPVTQMTQDCVHDDQIFPDGALIKTKKACEHCYCMKGDIVCVVQECGTPMENEGKNCTSMPPREGQCCPDTYICEGDELPTELATDLTQEPAYDEVTTLSPPRRVSVEGSGYRDVSEESYTELPTFEPEFEGSGEEQKTISPVDTTDVPKKEEPGLGEEIIASTEGLLHIPTASQAPDLQEPGKATTDLDEGQNTVPSGIEESSEPSVSMKTTPGKEIDVTEATVSSKDEQTTIPDYHITSLPDSSISREYEYTITTEPSRRKEDDDVGPTRTSTQKDTDIITTISIDKSGTQSYTDISTTEAIISPYEQEAKSTTVQLPEYISTSVSEISSEEETSIPTVEGEPSITTAPEISEQEPSITTAPEISEKEPSITTVPEVTEKEPSITTAPEISEKEPPITREPEVTEKEPSITTESEISEKEPSITTVPEVTEKEPSITTAPEISEKEPSITREPEVTEKEPSITTAPEISEKEASATTVPEITEREPSITTVPEVTEREPLITGAPEISEKEPSVTTVSDVTDKEPSITTAPEISEKEPSVTTVPEVTEKEPSITTEPEISEKEPSVTTAPEISEKEPPTTTEPEISEKEPSVTTVPEVTEKEPSITTEPEISEKESSVTTAPEISEKESSTTTAPEISEKESSTTTAPEISEKEPSITREPEVTEKEPSVTTAPEISEKEPSITREPEVTEKEPLITTAPEISDEKTSKPVVSEDAEKEPLITTAPEISEKEPSVTIVPEVTEKEPSITTEPEVTQKEPSITNEPEISEKEPSVTTVPEFTEKEPSITTELGVTEKEPSITTAPEISEKEPSVTTVLDVTDKEPSITTAPEISEKEPSVTTVPEVTEKEPSITTEPEISEKEPSVTIVPEISEKEPSITTELGVTDKEPSITTAPEISEKEPSVTTVPEVTEKEPSITTEPEVTQKEPSITTAPEISEKEPPITTVPEVTEKELSITTAPEILEKEPLVTTESEISEKEPSITTIPEDIGEPVFTTSIPDKITAFETTTLSPLESGRIPGEGDCLIDGTTYRNNSDIPSINKCHSSCRCVSSIVKCDPILCSPPPENTGMSNCQQVYETAESCCPTYVCDDSRETIPPESHSHVSGTESPITTPKSECNGDECHLDEGKEPKPEISDCGPEGCGVTQQPTHIPSTIPTESCTDGKCHILPSKEEPCNKETGCDLSISKPCEGDNCESVPSKEVPQPCDDEAGCKDIKTPETGPVLCEGDNCETEVGTISPESLPQHCKNGDCKMDETSKPSTVPCESEDCKTEIETVPSDGLPKHCENEEDCKEIKTPKPTTSTDIATSTEVLPQKCENDQDCKEIKTTEPSTSPCEGDDCKIVPLGTIPPLCENELECKQITTPEPEKTCEGKKCDTDVELPPKDVPQSCQSEEDCKEIKTPETSTTSCEGDNCRKTDTGPDTSAEVPQLCDNKNDCKEVRPPGQVPCEGSSCETEIDTTLRPSSEECTEENCRRKETPDVESKPPECIEDDCLQKPATSIKETTDSSHLSTDSPIPEESMTTQEDLSSKLTEPSVVIYTELPEYEGFTTKKPEPEDKIKEHDILSPEEPQVSTKLPELSYTESQDITSATSEYVPEQPQPEIPSTETVHIPEKTATEQQEVVTDTPEEQVTVSKSEQESTTPLQAQEAVTEQGEKRPTTELYNTENVPVTSLDQEETSTKSSEIPTNEPETTEKSQTLPQFTESQEVTTKTVQEQEILTELPPTTMIKEQPVETPQVTEPSVVIVTLEEKVTEQQEHVTKASEVEEQPKITVTDLPEIYETTKLPEQEEQLEILTKSPDVSITEAQTETSDLEYSLSTKTPEETELGNVPAVTELPGDHTSPAKFDEKGTEISVTKSEEISTKAPKLPLEPITDSQYITTETSSVTELSTETPVSDVVHEDSTDLPKAPVTVEGDIKKPEDGVTLPEEPLTTVPEIPKTTESSASEIFTIPEHKTEIPVPQETQGPFTNVPVEDTPQKTTETPLSLFTEQESHTKAPVSHEDEVGTTAPETHETEQQEFSTELPESHVTVTLESATKQDKSDTESPISAETTPHDVGTTPFSIQEKETLPESYVTRKEDLHTTVPEIYVTEKEDTGTEPSVTLVTNPLEESTTDSRVGKPEQIDRRTELPGVPTTESFEVITKVPEPVASDEDSKTLQPELLSTETPQQYITEQEFSTISPEKAGVQEVEDRTKQSSPPVTEKVTTQGLDMTEALIPEDETRTAQPEKEDEAINTLAPEPPVMVPIEPVTELYELDTEKIITTDGEKSSVTEKHETSTKTSLPTDTEISEPFIPLHEEKSTTVPPTTDTEEDEIKTEEPEKATKGHELPTTEGYDSITKGTEGEIQTKAPIQITTESEVTKEVEEEMPTKSPEYVTSIIPKEQEKPTEIPIPVVTDTLLEEVTVPEEGRRTEVPVSLVTEPQEVYTKKPEDNIIDHDDKVTQTPSILITQKEPYTEAPESFVTKEHELGTELPESHITAEKEITGEPESPITERVESVTEKQEQGTKSPELYETTRPDRLPAEPSEPSVEYATTYTEKQDETITKLPEEQTIAPEVQSEITVQESATKPQSTITEESEASSKSPITESEMSIDLETTKAPEVFVTESQGIVTVTPESPITKQEETGTELSVTIETGSGKLGEEGQKPTSTESYDHITKATEREPIPTESHTEGQTEVTGYLTERQDLSSKSPEEVTKLPEKPILTTEPQYEYSETTPYFVELEEHTHKVEIPFTVHEEEPYTEHPEIHIPMPTREELEGSTDKPTDEEKTEIPKEHEEKPIEDHEKISTVSESYPATVPLDEELPQKTSKPLLSVTETSSSEKQDESKYTTEIPKEGEHKEIPGFVTESLGEGEPTPTFVSETEKPDRTDIESPIKPEKDFIPSTEKPVPTDIPVITTASEEEYSAAPTKATTAKTEEEVSTQHPPSYDKFTKPEYKPGEAHPPTPASEVPKPPHGVQPVDELPPSEDDSHFPPSGSGYGHEPDYMEEDQAFGPGTCRYGGKVYVSAQQIPRDDPCDFCFCFRSDIICLQQSCPPPIHGCHEEPIQGFCCPRYECPVSMATTLNVTTTTTTTTTTLPPHFLPHAYKGMAQRRGCQIKGHTYKVGEVVRASSGPCLHCTCGGDGQMKCDPKACTPEPMLRQMIAAAVSAKRRR